MEKRIKKKELNCEKWKVASSKKDYLNAGVEKLKWN